MLTGEYPVTDFTPLGKIVASIIAVVAVAFFAIPTAVISSGFVKAVEQRNEEMRERRANRYSAI